MARKNQNYWEDITKQFIEFAIEAGLKLVGASDGEERIKSNDVQACADWAMQCGEGFLDFKDETNKQKCWVYVVSGNDAHELVTDYTCNDKLDIASDKHSCFYGG